MLFTEILKLIFFSGLIVLISKYILVSILRKLAEALSLKAQTVGDVAGMATSVPELLTITTASMRGLAGTSIYNILSSNILNLIQYSAAIFVNKNGDKLKNKAIKIDIVLVLITIIIPILLITTNIELNMLTVPIFIILYVFFRFLNNNAHKLYLEKQDKEIEEIIKKEAEKEKKNNTQAATYILILILTGIMLYVIGDLLGNTLENLCNLFNVPEIIVGIFLGVITSIPELITFFESQKHGKKNMNDMLGVVEATNNLLTSNVFNLFIIQMIGIILVNLIHH